MDFACSYLEKRAIFPEFINESPDANTGIIVVIPSFNEPDLTTVITSLAECAKPACNVELIVVINAPAGSPPEYFETNSKAISWIDGWKKANRDSFLRVHAIRPDTTSFSDWGVGLARKTGMDEAVRRFNMIGKPEGIILCLDADCTVRSDYLAEVYNAFIHQRRGCGCSVYFEHPLKGSAYPAEVYQAVALYELHMRYFLQGIIYSGYPNAFHTVGSAIAVQALPYVKAGGMNRRQAGEDFYFVQKLVSQCHYFYLKTTAVYPSPRPSSRVPFGTGITVSRMAGSGLGGFLTYNPESFIELKNFFSRIESLYHCKDEDIRNFYDSLPESIRQFVDTKQWTGKICEINKNTASLDTFMKRFFEWFNMFRIVKYLNFVHSDLLKKFPVAEAAMKMLELTGRSFTTDGLYDLLSFYRAIEIND